MEGSLIDSTQLNTAGSHMKHKLFLKPVANCEDIYPSNNARCNLHLLRLHTRSPINAPAPPLRASFSLLDSYYTAAYSWPEQPLKICSWVYEWEFSDVARNDTAGAKWASLYSWVSWSYHASQVFGKWTLILLHCKKDIKRLSYQTESLYTYLHFANIVAILFWHRVHKDTARTNCHA